ncbi:hypothetical protein H9L39_04913 [Fusarium oxysporum f. sp. albedinis]|nr:hypothetical protein H9L39_04913 [Fusarium oxysporum f. sp. albedinis]
MIEELTEYKDARTFQTPMVYFIPYRDKPFWLKSLLVFCCVAYVGMFAWRVSLDSSAMAWQDPAMCIVSAVEVQYGALLHK